MKKILSFIVLLVMILISIVSINQFIFPTNENYNEDIIVTQEEIIADALSIVNDIDVFNFMLFNDSTSALNSITYSLIQNSYFGFNDLIDFSTLSVGQVSQELADDFIGLIEEDPELKQIILLTILENTEDNKYQNMAMSASAVSLLLSRGIGQAAITTLNIAMGVIIGTLKAWFTPNVVKVVLIAAAVVSITAVILLNWNKIADIFGVVVNEFAKVAGDFATTIRSSFNNIIQMASKEVLMTVKVVDELVNAVRTRNWELPFYPAFMLLNRVWIVPTPMNQKQASTHLSQGKGFDTWTFFAIDAWRAASGVRNTLSVGVNNPEIHLSSNPLAQHFHHFHPNPRNGAHSLFGNPRNFFYG